jgi:FlaA1/EpsC-like NDP-sugar epimerase
MVLRGRHLLGLDALCVMLAFVLALALRLDAPSMAFQFYLLRFAPLIVPLLVVRISANLYFRLYQRLWRYASIDEMQAIVLTTTVGSLLFGLLVLGLSLGEPAGPTYGFPRSIVGIEWLLSLTFFGGSRFSLRILQAGRLVAGQRMNPAQVGTAKRMLIVGAGDAGATVAKELHLRPRLGMDPVGFIDDDPDKKGHLIHGVKVVGNRAEMRAAIASLAVNGVVVAMPTAPGTVVREILQECREIGIDVMTVPGIAELISGEVAVSQIRPVQVEDLLRREAASLDLESISGYLAGATVMITGAGGSIGSELCRQIVDFHPARLLLLGRGENSIYNIHIELQGRSIGAVELVPVIADIRDMPRLKAIMQRYRPSVVLHAAAHKHVPLMEANPSEAVANNVLGTRNLLDASAESGVRDFVLVSTDKAVNPSNVMGASKRIAELMLQETAARTGRRYVAVRFGNVLGSRGSVVPLFKRQIEAGGPLTITDKEMTRYFMTIPEAAQLIVQAGAMGRGGEIFVLDMGEPVRIYDLALDLIHLSGLEPFRDIDVEITGLRPGEKLYEELFTPSEERISTLNSRIFVSSLQPPDHDGLQEGLRELAELLSTGGADETGLRTAISRLVPEFCRAPMHAAK